MMRLYMTVEVDGDKVTPLVGLTTESYAQGVGGVQTPPAIETVRLGLDVASKMLGFAEGLRQG